MGVGDVPGMTSKVQFHSSAAKQRKLGLSLAAFGVAGAALYVIVGHLDGGGIEPTVETLLLFAPIALGGYYLAKSRHGDRVAIEIASDCVCDYRVSAKAVPWSEIRDMSVGSYRPWSQSIRFINCSSEIETKIIKSVYCIDLTITKSASRNLGMQRSASPTTYRLDVRSLRESPEDLRKALFAEWSAWNESKASSSVSLRPDPPP